MDKIQDKQEKSVSIRFPIDVLKKLHERAQQNNRSLNGEVLTAVREHIKRQKAKQ